MSEPTPAPVHLLHLTTGEDVIGEVTFDPETATYHVQKPVMPHVSMDPTSGGMRVGLMPLRPFVGDAAAVEFGAFHVVYHIPAGEQMEQAYRQYHSSLVLPDAPSLSTLLKG